MKFRDVFVLLKPYKKHMIIIMMLAIIIAVISAVTPFISQNMIDLGLLRGNVKTVIILVIFILLLQVVGKIMEYLQQKQEIEITNLLGEELKTKAFEHGLRLKPHYYKENTFYNTINMYRR